MTDPTTVNESLGKMRAIESELGALFIEREEVVRAMLLALLSREHLALIGPPGTAKSMLITELAKRVGDSAGNGLRCFVYLLTKFTTPEELFGPVSISGLKADDYRRVTTGKLADVELAFLDETFKASSAILNYLLRLMNEREFENGRHTAQVPLISLFGASNELPQEAELEALFDRFLLRMTVGYVSESGFTFALVMEDVDYRALGLNYATDLRIQLHKKTGQMICTTQTTGRIESYYESQQVAAELQPYWREFKDLHVACDLSEMTRRIIDSLQATALRMVVYAQDDGCPSMASRLDQPCACGIRA